MVKAGSAFIVPEWWFVSYRVVWGEAALRWKNAGTVYLAFFSDSGAKSGRCAPWPGAIETGEQLFLIKGFNCYLININKNILI